MRIYIVQTRPSAVSPDIVENVMAFNDLRTAEDWAAEREEAGEYPKHSLSIDVVELAA